MNENHNFLWSTEKMEKGVEEEKNRVNNDNYESIDLDKELLGTKLTKFKHNEILHPQKDYQEDCYLSPNIQWKESIYSRKITGITDNTKADSVLKNNGNILKKVSKLKEPKGFDLESFPN